MDSELKKLCKMDSTSDIIGDMEQIINRSRNIAYLYVNRALVLRNWLIGRRIDQEILKDQSFEDNYGKKLIVDLSRKLTSEYGKGFSLAPSTSMSDSTNCFRRYCPQCGHNLFPACHGVITAY